MTKTDHPVVRETYSTFRGRPLVIELRSTFIRIKRKGTRTWFEASYDQIWNRAVLNRVAQVRADRASRRKKGGGR